MTIMAARDLKRVVRAAHALDEARRDLHEAMRIARQNKETYDAIGKAAGLTAQRVQQIVNGK